MESIAVLLTCHNRKKTTIECLENLFLPKDVNFDVFLVDDGSTDGTGEAVRNVYPHVNVIDGTGDLFWNQGMLLAWKSAASANDYDFYIWLNDDTKLRKDSIIKLFKDYSYIKNDLQEDGVIVGSCVESTTETTFSYGGRNHKNPVIPNGLPQECNYINGNFVLIPKIVFERVGFLSSRFTHAIGDIDYGFKCC